MGIACCRSNYALTNDSVDSRDTGDNDFEASSAVKKIEDTYQGSHNIRRDTWFTEQCHEEGDEELFSKRKTLFLMIFYFNYLSFLN